tara:strand:- start:211 stop:492 length:282 start_codon:yes stop_codon:yes gene_type:complete
MWAAIAGIAANAFLDDGKTASGQPASKGESIASKILGLTGEDMKESHAFYTASRDERRQETKAKDPSVALVQGMFAERQKADKDFARWSGTLT